MTATFNAVVNSTMAEFISEDAEISENRLTNKENEVTIFNVLFCDLYDNFIYFFSVQWLRPSGFADSREKANINLPPLRKLLSPDLNLHLLIVTGNDICST